MEIVIKKFSELSLTELYELLALRTQIFVVEQNCAYQEVDNHDQNALHIIGYKDEKMMAYARLVAPGQVYEEPSIGRVCVHEEHRGHQFGRTVFMAALEKAKALYPKQTLKIQAQVYLEEFYRSVGFKTISKPYPDFGIWHVDMIKDYSS